MKIHQLIDESGLPDAVVLNAVIAWTTTLSDTP